jgi:hypothetical protein
MNEKNKNHPFMVAKRKTLTLIYHLTRNSVPLLERIDIVTHHHEM